jgi:hypothetical protein
MHYATPRCACLPADGYFGPECFAKLSQFAIPLALIVLAKELHIGVQ